MVSVKRSRIVVAGELNVDLIASGLEFAPEFDRDTLAESFEMALGGASANFACGAARLGNDVTFVSKVGRDSFGDFCLKALRDLGLSTRDVRRDSEIRTGVSIAISTTRDRMFVTYLGTISRVEFDEIPWSRLKGYDHLHLTSYFLQDRLRPRVPELFDRARSMGLTTSFDPNDDPSKQWDASIRDVFSRTDVLFLNESEAASVTGETTTRAALRALGKLVPTAVVKLGRRGATAIEGGRVVRVPGFKVAAVDTTGAGDTFAAGFVTARLDGHPLEECLRRANACGALCAMMPGATANQPDRAALERFLAAHSTN